MRHSPNLKSVPPGVVPCEECPDELSITHRQKDILRLQHHISICERDLSLSTLRDSFNGRRADIKAHLHSDRRLLDTYEQAEPQLDDVAACKGPFERTVEEDGTRWCERICGARVLDHVLGVRVDTPDAPEEAL